MEKSIISDNIASPKRADALDALRGFAILMMVFSGLIPYKVLPAWMYHGQEPPPTHVFNPNIAGLTWVDLVFPIFLFSMGAAIPLALSRRLEKGWSIKEIILSIFKRGFLLGTFAIFLQHIRPHRINPSPNTLTWGIALLGFILLFLMFVRWPDAWTNPRLKLVTWGAWILAIILLAVIHYPDGSGFSLTRSDIILILLADAAVFASLIWLFTPSNWLLRLGSLGLLLAFRLSASSNGWIDWLWSFSPAPWIFKFEYVQYLFLVIPGTIAGDLIYSWLHSRNLEQDFLLEKPVYNWTKQRFLIIVVLMLSICLTLLTGLQARWVWQTTLLCLALCTTGWFLFAKPAHETEVLLHRLYTWAIYWLGLGLLFEPYEGGIKKDSPTMSYYFVNAAIALFLLITFTIIIDILKQKKWVQLLVYNGQNPMIAYVGIANLIWPVLGITQIYPWILENTKTPGLGIIRAIVYTCVLALIVSFFTKKKIFLRT
jgi:predicted acyltransferase